MKRLSNRKALRGVSLAFCATLTVSSSPADAGDFSIDWSTFDWPAGFAGPLLRTLSDQYGFEIDTTVEITGNLRPYSADAQGNPIFTPDDVNILGGGVDSLVIVGDAAPNAGRRFWSLAIVARTCSYGQFHAPSPCHHQSPPPKAVRLDWNSS